ncbi:MAG: hypothetical protein E6Q97_25300 [Desulfurellales bacterium]|jgi:hypothetical protein|nr:MAG: hypothetical protein E6Q97_25300 [Desulfurellales bacterium]
MTQTDMLIAATGKPQGATNNPTQAPSIQTAPPNGSRAAQGIPANAIHCRCGAWWTGTMAGHCTACHQTFTSIRSFDIHRTGSHAHGTRTCLNPASITTQAGNPALIPANKPWPGWSEPGTWEGPET